MLISHYIDDTIGHNIANAQTPGYSRQRVDLAQSMPTNVRGLLIGQGVDSAVFITAAFAGWGAD